MNGDRASAVVKVLCYKSGGRWFDPSWCQWIFHWHKILPIALWHWGRLSLWQKWAPGIFPGGKGGRCVRLTTLPPSCAVVMKSGNLNFLEPSGPLQACDGTAIPLPLPLRFTEMNKYTTQRHPSILSHNFKTRCNKRSTHFAILKHRCWDEHIITNATRVQLMQATWPIFCPLTL